MLGPASKPKIVQSGFSLVPDALWSFLGHRREHENSNGDFPGQVGHFSVVIVVVVVVAAAVVFASSSSQGLRKQ